MFIWVRCDHSTSISGLLLRVASLGRCQGGVACVGDASMIMNLISSRVVRDDQCSAKGGQDSTGTKRMSSVPCPWWYLTCSAPSCLGLTKCCLFL